MKEFIVQTDLDLSCVIEFTGAGDVSFKPHGELIRCKDCAHAGHDHNGLYCYVFFTGTEENAFCSEADRKEED